MSRTLVIAEPGCTHEGDYATLLELLRTAKACGADVWKPQWTSDPVQMCERRHIGPDHPKRDYYLRAYSWLNFPVEWHAEFKAICQQIGLQYAVTCFLPQDVGTVAPYVDYLKVASFENCDASMLRVARKSGKPIIVSTGAMKRWSWAFWRLKWWQWRSGVRLLQCTSAYPVSLDQVHLLAMVRCGMDGLSDHSRDMVTGGFAVAAGASVVEAHYALYECDADNPDYPCAFSPGEFEIYVKNIRKAESARGLGDKHTYGQETWAVRYKVEA